MSRGAGIATIAAILIATVVFYEKPEVVNSYMAPLAAAVVAYTAALAFFSGRRKRG